MFWARFNQSLQLYDVASARITQEWDESQGSQRSVDWSPVDNRLLTTLEHFGSASDLVILDGDERTYFGAWGGRLDVACVERHRRLCRLH
ncbi:MAG UNVERIFIED_CONTAM: hypothetical protein LVT10_09090 [Anaerolineae bacterium]